MEVNINEILIQAKKWSEEYLEKLFNIYRDEAVNTHPTLRTLIDAISDYTLRGGKRLRAMLVLTGYWSKNPSLDPEPVKYVMASIELLQSYFLVHDDIMDRDEVRRGGPTVHVMFKNACFHEKLLNDCIHYGISQGILAGDYLNALVMSVMSLLPLSYEIKFKLVEKYSEIMRKVAYGQYLDVYFAYKSIREVKEYDILKIHELKTASYTVELPLFLGAITANITDKKIYDVFLKFSKPAGIAFQLRDDIIGLYGDPRITGKPVGSDVREKKKTLLVVKAYEWGNNEVKKFLEEIYDRKKQNDITDEDVRMVQEIVKETGSLDYSEKLIGKLYNEAMVALEDSKEISDYTKNVLKQLLQKLVYREK